MSNTPNFTVIAIVGPTASGKTAAALTLAKHFPCEIISLDSALVYRDMNIGTAKPNPSELAAVPHHLIDIIDPSETYSVAQFRRDCLQLAQDIHNRGKIPLLVGGTMMYFKALQSGLDDLPAADPIVRARLDEDIAREGIEALHLRLAQCDPETAARLKPQDSQRIQRALEIFILTGQSMSSLIAKQVPDTLAFDLLTISLEPSDRLKLHERIAQRFDLMLEQGFLEEVKTLRLRSDLHIDLPSIRCVGYRQAWEYLDGKYDFAMMREQGIIATRQLAKRQLTWLRSMPERIVFDCLDTSVNQGILQLVQSRLTQRP